MKKYKVILHFEAGFETEVEANNEELALAFARSRATQTDWLQDSLLECEHFVTEVTEDLYPSKGTDK